MRSRAVSRNRSELTEQNGRGPGRAGELICSQAPLDLMNQPSPSHRPWHVTSKRCSDQAGECIQPCALWWTPRPLTESSLPVSLLQPLSQDLPACPDLRGLAQGRPLFHLLGLSFHFGHQGGQDTPVCVDRQNIPGGFKVGNPLS